MFRVLADIEFAIDNQLDKEVISTDIAQLKAQLFTLDLAVLRGNNNLANQIMKPTIIKEDERHID
jgi:hypothetical protein